jgi:hypothetical protein
LRESGFDTLRGFRVEAADGEVGKVDQVLYWTNTDAPDFIVIGTGKWVFGHKAVISVKDIVDVDIASRMVKMSLSSREIRNAPEFLPLT